MFTFTILKVKNPGDMVISGDDITIYNYTSSISGKYFKLTLTIKCAVQQIKKAKQKRIQTVNPELPNV